MITLRQVSVGRPNKLQLINPFYFAISDAKKQTVLFEVKICFNILVVPDFPQYLYPSFV